MSEESSFSTSAIPSVIEKQLDSVQGIIKWLILASIPAFLYNIDAEFLGGKTTQHGLYRALIIVWASGYALISYHYWRVVSLLGQIEDDRVCEKAIDVLKANGSLMSPFSGTLGNFAVSVSAAAQVVVFWVGAIPIAVMGAKLKSEPLLFCSPYIGGALWLFSVNHVVIVMLRKWRTVAPEKAMAFFDKRWWRLCSPILMVVIGFSLLFLFLFLGGHLSPENEWYLVVYAGVGCLLCFGGITCFNGPTRRLFKNDKRDRGIIG